jgi:hypothetical protein
MKKIFTKSNLAGLLAAVLMTVGLSAFSQYHYMGAYAWDGKPKYLVSPADTVGVNFRANITATLPEYRSVPVYNPRLIADGRTETIGVKCPSDVWITFVDEGAAYQNVLGYYTYKTDSPLIAAPPASKINIIFPNASKSGFGGGLNPGDKVYLGNFPPNTSIGFVLLANGWDGVSETVSSGKWVLYSDSRFNPEADTTLKKHTVMLHDTASSRIVVGFEDIRRDGYGSDQDFNDLLFFATVTPVPCVATLDSIPDLTPDGHISFSGGSGGLESKSLGTAITDRVYHKAMNNRLGAVNYSNLQSIDQLQATAKPFGGGSSLALIDMMPTSIPDSGIVGYITTPNDIPSITNAVDVSAVDFTLNSQCRAVAFATKTLGAVYDHTKAICDRVKGARLLSMDNFVLNNFNIVRYTLQQADGNVEYSMSFTIGKKSGRNSFSFQSNWLNNDYTPEDTLYNFQVWGAAPYYCVDMTLEILKKLNNIMPVQQLKASAALPSTYIINGNRDGLNLNLAINNNSKNVSGYFLIDNISNETNTAVKTTAYPFSIAANAVSNLAVPVSDAYESLVSLYINNQLQDVVFISDGAWACDFTKVVAAAPHTFTVTNDTIARSNSDVEFNVLRNIQVNATTADYVSVYKLMRGGGLAQDLSAYNTMRLAAAGAGTNLHIYLIKNSITNFADQYNYAVPLNADLKDYSINLSDFKSAKYSAKVDLTDIVQIVFGFEVNTGKLINVNALLGNVLFSKQSADYYNRADAGDVQIFPNPSSGQFTTSFKSSVNTVLTLKIVDPGTGKTITGKTINAVKGINNIPLEITQNGLHVYMLSIQGDSSANYQTKKIVVDKK